MNTLTANNPIAKILALTVIVCVLQMSLSWPLWWVENTRTYPLIPVFNFIGTIANKGINNLLLMATFIVMGLMTWAAHKQIWIVILLALFAILILIDINRLQAWLYQYLLIWAAGLWAYSAKTEGQTSINQGLHRERIALFLIQMVFIATYVWAGINKLNVHYLTNVFNWLVGIFEWSSFLKNNYYAAVCSALVEITVGIGLVFNRTRRGAVVLGVIMHALILILLITDGWNKIVYPWNVGMSLGLYILFWNDEFGLTISYFKQNLTINVYAFLLFVAPILNIFGLWQYNLANTMYSGISLEVEIVALDTGMSCLPPKFNNGKTYGVETDSSFNLDLDDWVMHEFAAPYYAEEWIIPVLQKKYCPCLRQYGGFIRIETAARWSKTKRIKTIPCR